MTVQRQFSAVLADLLELTDRFRRGDEVDSAHLDRVVDEIEATLSTEPYAPANELGQAIAEFIAPLELLERYVDRVAIRIQALPHRLQRGIGTVVARLAPSSTDDFQIPHWLPWKFGPAVAIGIFDGVRSLLASSNLLIFSMVGPLTSTGLLRHVLPEGLNLVPEAFDFLNTTASVLRAAKDDVSESDFAKWEDDPGDTVAILQLLLCTRTIPEAWKGKVADRVRSSDRPLARHLHAELLR